MWLTLRYSDPTEVSMFVLLIACAGRSPVSTAPPPPPPEHPAPVAAPAPEEMVLVATPVHELPAAQPIRAEDIHLISIPRRFVPDGVLTPDDPLVGRVPKDRILAHEFIRPERLNATPSGTSMPAGSMPVAADQGPAPTDVMVILAARDFDAGTRITEADLYAVQIPAAYLPEGVFLSPEHVVGRITCERILQNEFVRAPRLGQGEDCTTP